MIHNVTARKVRILLAFLVFGAGGVSGSAVGVAWLSIRDTWGLPTASLGILLLALTGGFLSGSFVSGRLVTRFGMGSTLVLSNVVTAIGLLGFSLAPGWLALIAVAILSGLGKGTLGASLNIYFANHFNARMMNWLHASFSIGAMLGPFLVQFASTEGNSWRIVWLALALVQLLFCWTYYLTRGGWHSTPQTAAAGAPDAPSMLATLRNPAVLLGMTLFIVFTGIEASAGSWSFTLFSEDRVTDSALATFWVGLYWGSFALGRIVFGLIADKLPFVTSIRILLFAVMLGGLMFSLRDSVAISLAGLLLIGFAQAPVTPLLFSTTPVRLGAGHATNAIGFQMSAAGVGFAALPALVGVIASYSSFEILGPFLALSALLSLLLFHLIVRSTSVASPA